MSIFLGQDLNELSYNNKKLRTFDLELTVIFIMSCVTIVLKPDIRKQVFA